MHAELALKRLMVAGRAVRDNYDVIYRGYPVGHIMHEAAPGRTGQSWSWGNARMPNESEDHGYAATFEDAKADFLAAWLKPGDPLTRLYWLRERLSRAPDPAAMNPQSELIEWNGPVVSTT